MLILVHYTGVLLRIVCLRKSLATALRVDHVALNPKIYFGLEVSNDSSVTLHIYVWFSEYDQKNK